MQQPYYCSNCGAKLDPGVKFCTRCGKRLELPEQRPTPQQYECPVCRTGVAPGAEKCAKCGTPFTWQEQKQAPEPPAKPEKPVKFRDDDNSSKALKYAGIAILGVLLFLSLTAFGPAFMVDRTVLNPGFVASEVNRLEIAPLASEMLSELPAGEMPVEISQAFTAAITKLEPTIKAEINSAVYTAYDYIKGKRDNPELAQILRSTFLSNQFLYAVIDEVEITPLVKPFLHEQLGAIIPQEMTAVSAYLYPIVDDFLADHESWIKEQLKIVADPVADYLVGDIKTFNVDISIEPLISDLKQTLTTEIAKLPLLELAGLPPGLVQLFISGIFDELSAYIPATIEVNNSMIGAHIPMQIASAITGMENTLSQLKQYAGYFQTGYILLIIFMLLLIAGIILIYRQVKGASRTLGIVFLISGALQLTVLLLAKNFIAGQFSQAISDFPAQLQNWMLQLINNLTSPWQVLCIGLIAGGILLIIVSVIWKPRQAI